MRKANLACLSICLALTLLLAACRPASPTAIPFTSTPPAQPTSARTATLNEIEKLVEFRLSEAEAFGLAVGGQKLCTGAQVRTGAASTARIDFDQGTVSRLAPNTLFTVAALPTGKNEPVARLRLTAGKIWVTVAGGGVEVETPAGVAAIRGSFAEFEYWPGDPNNPADDVMVVRCLEGVCGVLGKNAKLIVLGNLELVTLTINNQPASRAQLGPEAVAEFIRNNPESAGLAPTLTAAAQPSPTVSATPFAPNTRTATPTRTATRKPTTATPIKTNTPWVATTWTKSLAPSLTVSRTSTPSLTPSRTLTLAPSATRTVTSATSPTFTLTSAPSATRTLTPVITPTTTGTAALTSTPSSAATATPTPTVTATLNPTGTPTVTSAPTETSTPTTTDTPTATDTQIPTGTATEAPTETPSPTST